MNFNGQSSVYEPGSAIDRRELLLSLAAVGLTSGAMAETALPQQAIRDKALFFPTAPAPARKLIVVDCHDASPDEHLLLMSLQGLVNREKPRIYLIPNSRWIGDKSHEPPEHRRDEFWLAWLRKRRLVLDTERISGDATGIADLLTRFAHSYRGAVVPDPDLPVSNNIAISIAGVEDLLVCTAALAENYHLQLKIDLRGRFAMNHQAMEWVWQTYRSKLNHQILATGHPKSHHALPWAFPVDYYIQNRVFVFWVTGVESLGSRKCNAKQEKAVIERILADLPPCIPVCGFTWAGTNEGMGEFEGVKMISEWGDVLIAIGIPNLSVHTGYHLSRLRQRPSRRISPRLDRSKTYVTLTTSDGDALGTFYNYHVDWFLAGRNRHFPIGIGVGPGAIDLIPAIADWYYDQATPTNEFFCDVSGIGYMYPEHFANRRPNRDAVVLEFLSWTDRYMARMDQHGLRPYQGDKQWLDLCSDRLSRLRYLVPGYGAENGDSNASSRTRSGLPVFNAVTPLVEVSNEKAFISAIDKAAAVGQPAFLNGFVNITLDNWTFLYALPDIIKKLGDRYVFVTPSELADLYLQSTEASSNQ